MWWAGTVWYKVPLPPFHHLIDDVIIVVHAWRRERTATVAGELSVSHT